MTPNDVSFQPTPLKGTRRAGERRFAGGAWDSRALDEQYAFAWPRAWSRNREDRVLPGLYVGGLEAAKAAEGFDLIVNLSGIPRTQRIGATPEIAWPIDDASELPDLESLWHLARMIAGILRSSPTTRVLLHCAAGINRSALLAAAVVMVIRDCNGATAMRIVRRGRRGALCNPTFEKFLAGHGRPSRRRRRDAGVRKPGIYWPTEVTP